MNKTSVTILILVVVVAGGYFLLKSGKVQAPSQETPQTSTSGMPVPNTQTPEKSVTPVSPVNESPSADQNQNVVTYTDAGYSPNTLTVKLGTTVTWKNNSSLTMWTASAFHPTHKAYPTTGGCLGSTFDACQGIQPGDSWSFSFTKVGTWGYHDHLHPSFYGKIVVE